MAVIHKVIVLNTPFKIFGFSLMQWLFIAGSAGLGCWLGFNMPAVKFNGVQLGIWVAIIVFCAGLVFANASQIKPWQWWRNRVLFLARLLPTEILPKLQPSKPYIEDIKGKGVVNKSRREKL